MPWDWIGLTIAVQKAGTTSPPAPAQTITLFSADTLFITQGQSVNLSWATSNATSVRLNGVPVAANAVGYVVTPTTSMNYVLDVDGSVPTVSQTLAVVVSLQPPVDPSAPQGRLALVGNNTLVDCFPTVNLGYEMGSMGFRGVISNGSWAFAPNYGTMGGLAKCGGGHGDGGANEVYIYDIARALWARLSDPSMSVLTKAQSDTLDCWTNHNTTYGELLDGSPMACHGFNILTVIPGGTNGKGQLLRVAAPALGVGPGDASAPFAHVADLGVAPIAPATTIWSRFARNFCTYNTWASTPVPYAHTYDVVNNCAWGVYPGSHGLLTKLDLGTRLYTNYTTVSGSWGFMPVAAAHPVRGLMVYIAGYSAAGAGWNSPQYAHLNAVDLANPTAGMKQLTLQGDPFPVPTMNLGAGGNYLSPWSLDWDTVNDVGYITAGDQDPTHLWRVTPPASDYLNQPWTITKITLPGSLPLLAPAPKDTTIANYDVIYGHWRYCPSIKAFAYLSHTGQDKARFPDDGKIALWYTP